jgi:ribokinase
VKAGVIRSVLGNRNALVSVDPGGEARKLRPDDLKGIDVLLMNEVECASMTGLDYRGGAEVLRGFAGTVVVKRGEKGAFAVGQGSKEEVEAAAFRVDVADTTGAGDAFDAGFMAALICGRHLREALTWGAGAAAMKIQKRGARNGLPTRRELMEFLSARARFHE